MTTSNNNNSRKGVGDGWNNKKTAFKLKSRPFELESWEIMARNYEKKIGEAMKKWHSENLDMARRQSIRAKQLWATPECRKKFLARFAEYHQRRCREQQQLQQQRKEAKKFR